MDSAVSSQVPNASVGFWENQLIVCNVEDVVPVDWGTGAPWLDGAHLPASLLTTFLCGPTE